jgi:hypothetical protein
MFGRLNAGSDTFTSLDAARSIFGRLDNYMVVCFNARLLDISLDAADDSNACSLRFFVAWMLGCSVAELASTQARILLLASMPLGRYLVAWTIGWLYASMLAWMFRSMLLIARMVARSIFGRLGSIFGRLGKSMAVCFDARFDTFACFDASLECSLAAILGRLDDWMFGRFNARSDALLASMLLALLGCSEADESSRQNKICSLDFMN